MLAATRWHFCGVGESKSMAKFQFPKFRVIQRTERDGTLIEEPISAPVCDFCYDERITHDVRVRPFSIGDFQSEDDFAACSDCADCITLAAWGALKYRVFESWKALGIRHDDKAWNDIDIRINAVRQHLIGEPIRLPQN